MDLQGQVALITGAGRNIGAETAKLLAQRGARVAVADNDAARGDKVAAEIRAQGGDAQGFVADVANEDDLRGLVDGVVRQWGRIDILVNNAAVSDNKDILEITRQEWDSVMAVTLTGPFLLSKYAAAQMLSQEGGGKIINIASTSGFYGRKRAVAYAAAKGGVIALTRAMAVQLGPRGIRVNAVVPNKIGSPVGKDEFDPNRPIVNLRGRPGVPLDMARAVAFLASDESDFIVGDMLLVDGGVTALMPGE